jgi:hypothetical protein
MEDNDQHATDDHPTPPQLSHSPSIFTPPQMEEAEAERDDIPIWLQTGPEMKGTASRMNYETISFHILDAGYGACAVMTFRELESEADLKASPTPGLFSSSGILGRLLCSVRRKMLEVHPPRSLLALTVLLPEHVE